MKVVSLVDKVDLRSTVNTCRRATMNHSLQAKENGATQGVFISRCPDGTIIHDSWGVTAEERIALLETAKYCTLRELYG